MNPSETLRRGDIGAAAKLILLALPAKPCHISNLPTLTGLSLRTVYRAIVALKSAGLILSEKRGVVQRS